MKANKKTILTGVGIFAAAILLTGMMNRYMISKTNKISENVVDVPVEVSDNKEPVKVPVLPEPPILEPAPEPEEQPIEANIEKFEPQLPLSGGIMAGYTGDKPVFSETLNDFRAHPGIDIYGAVGETVKSIEQGTVKMVCEDRKYGQTVTIEHTDGFISTYANLDSEVSVQEGEKVSKGQAIGIVGETAWIEQNIAPHLHFEMFKGGEAINPEMYLDF